MHENCNNHTPVSAVWLKGYWEIAILYMTDIVGHKVPVIKQNPEPCGRG